jgi:hypothetical protein
MRNVFLASFVAALALSAAPARADEVEYPVQEKIFASRVDSTPIVTSDVTYLGEHAVVAKSAPGPGLSAVATSEDFLYLPDDPAPAKAAPTHEVAPASRMAKSNCTCQHHG